MEKKTEEPPLWYRTDLKVEELLTQLDLSIISAASDRRAFALTMWLKRNKPEIYGNLPREYKIVNHAELYKIQSTISRVLVRNNPLSSIENYLNGFFERFYIVRNLENPERVQSAAPQLGF